MGYASGAKKLWELIEDIANGLIAAPGGYWTDADTTWNTSDKTANNARRVLKYLNGTEELYVALQAINQTSGFNYFYSGGWYYAKGLRIYFSATWDSILHQPPTSNYATFIPFEGNSVNAGAGADLATLQLTYYLWIESNGFVLFAKPEPHADAYQQSFIAVVERNPNKEYSDGYTNFYCYAYLNAWDYYDGDNNVAQDQRFRSFLRPFAFRYPDASGDVNPANPNGNGLSFVPTPSYYAYKSSGNGKAYYVKPIIHNVSGSITPIFQAELWFPWSETVGLIDGDVIAIEGQTTKFLCKALDSPDSVGRLNIAIKYVA